MKASASLLLLANLATCGALASRPRGQSTKRAIETSSGRPASSYSRGKKSPNNRNERAYALRSAGVRVKSSGSNTPRWEKEGDALYHEVRSDVTKKSAGGAVLDAATAREMLDRLAPLETVTRTRPAASKATAKEESVKKTPPPSTLWGGLSVGPVLRSRLVGASLPHPTPVQSAAFPVITSRKNAVIASPTGTGKSLSYLIPLLASSEGGDTKPCQIMVVTPTVELACQLRREVDRFWPGRDGTGALHVVEDGSPEGAGEASVLAGTPRSFLKLLAEADSVQMTGEAGAVVAALRSNLRTVVLDEADGLLRTSRAAREADEKRMRREAPSKSKKKKKGKPARADSDPTPTEVLLSRLPGPSLRHLQIICASATVGRTLRRQLMDILNAPSMDKAAVLVTAESDPRTKKDATRRKTGLLPDALRHRYRLLSPETKKDGLEEGADAQHLQTAEALWQTMQGLEPAPTVVFPGRAGVDRVRKALQERGMKQVRTLSMEMSEELSSTENADWGGTPVYIVGEKFGRGLDLPGIGYVFLLSPPSSAAGYAHLAGRTARNGKQGTAITLVRPREAPRVVKIAQALGLSFEELRVSDAADVEESAADDIDVFSWAPLSETALKRKTIAQLTAYLEAGGVSLPEPNGKRQKKDDLISAVQTFHATSDL